MSNMIALAVETLVAVLLAVTIAYCFVLNRRLMKLRADESAMKAMIAELVTATDIAERAIAGLKQVAQESDLALGEKLARADSLSHSLGAQLDQSEAMMERLCQITAAARGERPAPEAGTPATDTVRQDRAPAKQSQISSVAQEFLARARERRAQAAA